METCSTLVNVNKVRCICNNDLSILPIDMPIDNFLATMIYRKEIVAYGVQSQLVRQHMINKHNSSDINHTGR